MLSWHCTQCRRTPWVLKVIGAKLGRPQPRVTHVAGKLTADARQVGNLKAHGRQLGWVGCRREEEP